jgi:DNA invertase Pin-like site-specific DNA recombinase
MPRQKTDQLRAALYARVSLDDSRQDPQTQLDELHRFASDRGYYVACSHVDRAGAQDLRGRKGWREILEEARRGKLDMIVVWKLDRAFRSTLEALRCLEELNHEGVGFVCVTQPIDTTSPTGRLLFTILSALAEIELDMIRERTRAGMARARRLGKKIGRPKGRLDSRPRRRRLSA